MEGGQTAATARLKANNARKGLVQVSVWVPEECRQDMIDRAADLRHAAAVDVVLKVIAPG